MISKTSTSRLQKAYSILFFSITFFAMAQEGLPTPYNNVNDTKVVPIDDYIPLALLLGIYFAYRFLKPTITSKQLNN